MSFPSLQEAARWPRLSRGEDAPAGQDIPAMPELRCSTHLRDHREKAAAGGASPLPSRCVVLGLAGVTLGAALRARGFDWAELGYSAPADFVALPAGSSAPPVMPGRLAVAAAAPREGARSGRFPGFVLIPLAASVASVSRCRRKGVERRAIGANSREPKVAPQARVPRYRQSPTQQSEGFVATDGPATLASEPALVGTAAPPVEPAATVAPEAAGSTSRKAGPGGSDASVLAAPAAADGAKGAASRADAPALNDPDYNEGLTQIIQFAQALWGTLLEISTGKNPGEGGFEYKKGIEGMSMGSLHYEMLTTTEGTDKYKVLSKEYERGWGVPFVDVRALVRNVKDFVGVDAFLLTATNILQTAGLGGDAVDGIPVQNKWMRVVSQSVQDMLAGEDDERFKNQAGDFFQNIVTGQMERVAGAPMPVFLEDYGEGRGVYKIAIGPRSVVVVSDPVILKKILQSQDKYSKGILSEVLEPIMGKGLIPADPVTWKTRRRAIAPGFHKRWLLSTTSLMADCAESLCNELEGLARRSSTGGSLVNMEEKFTSVSLDIIGQAIFDYDFGSVERESPVVHAVYGLLREAERRAQAVIPYWDLPGASSVFRDQKEHEENLLLLNAVLDELIRTAMEEPEHTDRISLLKYLVDTKGQDVTTRQLRDDLMTLLVAGHETTAALLTWTLYELMKPEKSDVLAEVVEEVDTVLGGASFTFEDFDKFPKLRCVLYEALRLYPEPPMLIRRCEDGDEVPVGPTCGGVSDTIKFLPGQDIFISTWSLQRSRELWGEDAAEFRPSRWGEPLPGKGLWAGYNPNKRKGYPGEIATDFAFVPFGGGSRKCLGDNFALLEAEVIMTKLLQRFDFSRPAEAGERVVRMTTGATIHTVGGLTTRVACRSEAPTLKPVRSQPEHVDLRPHMDAKTTLSVAERVDDQQMSVPTAAELRMLFNQQAVAVNTATSVGLASTIESAYAKCQEVTRENSKTFYLGSQFLSTAEQRAVWAIYNWCRETDELVDGPLAETTTMNDLEEWEQRLNRTFSLASSLDPAADWADLALAAAIRRFGLIQRPFQDMIGGMAMDLVKDRYETFGELEVYCYRVAGTVGIMTLPILGFDGLQNFSKELKENTIAAAMSLGVAFQLTNVLRDVGEDARRGRIYVPLEDLRRFGITEEEVLEAANTEGLLYHEARWKDFMEFQFGRCEAAYKEAECGIIGLSDISRLGVMAALYVYRAIMDEVRANEYDNFSRRAYVDFWGKIQLLAKAWGKCQELKRAAEENVRSGRVFTANKQAGSAK